MKHLKLFKLKSDYRNYIQSENALLPNVSFVQETIEVFYNPGVKNYLRFVAIEDSQINFTSFDFHEMGPDTSVDLKYSKDGMTWTQYDFTPIPLAAGEILYLKGNNENGLGHAHRGCTFGDFSRITGIQTTPSTGKFKCYGNIMALLYGDDFENKTTIPSLNCFFGMFAGCTGLTTAPELPATTLTSDCYANMFDSCTSLIKAPVLPATKLAPFCYFHMFWGCTNLYKITMLATDISAERCLTMWTGMLDSETDEEVSGVAKMGVFVKNSNMNNLPVGNQENSFSGIPEGWVVEDYEINDDNQPRYDEQYLTLEALEDAYLRFITTVAPTDLYEEEISTPYEYSYDGINWIPYDNSEIHLTSGQRILWKGYYEKWGGNMSFNLHKTDENMDGDANFIVYGNVMSLLYGDEFYGKTEIPENFRFNGLFLGNIYLTDASNLILPATTLSNYCYEAMFSNCTSLTTAPALPATTLAERCYSNMFYGCESLTTTPELPATTLSDGCYEGMFAGCVNLTTAPKLPVTTLSRYCYSRMFEGCQSLTTAPELPATILTEACYQSMFYGCESLTTTPELPATTLAERCYSYMFCGCHSLTAAPELPATTLFNNCYANMFQYCSSLTIAPELPATELANECYYCMFYDCANLTTAPEILPAITLEKGCYQSMFYSCENLTTAPEILATTAAENCCNSMFLHCTSLTTAPSILPATTLAKKCYYGMFWYCASLTTAPVLPATTLAESCYWNMFASCTSLNHITMLATITASYCLTGWVYNVASTGTFVKNPNMNSLPTGTSGIPEGWTVVDYQE